MTLVVLGSVSLNQYIPFARIPNDLDILGTYDEVEDFIKSLSKYGERVLAQYPINGGKALFVRTDKRVIEATIAWPDSAGERLREFIRDYDNMTMEIADTEFEIPSFNTLYMLKMSHRYLKNSPHFLKTMRDIQLMRMHGASIEESHEEFYKQRMKDTYTYSHPKLNVSKDEFFTDSVPYVYQHDDIHEAVKHFDKPAYSYFKPDESEVKVSREMFEALDEQTKLYSVLEEAYVLALERSQIPYPDTDKKKSFDMALMKVCSSITSGWFREYAWENYDKVMALYNPRYTDLFWLAATTGKVKLHNT